MRCISYSIRYIINNMNLFLISLNVEEAAQGLCDQLCVKMILESVQLLYSVFHMRVGTPKVQTLARKYGLVAYKLTHKFHPIAIWARKKVEHYKFLVKYTMALLEEYHYRYGKNHACPQNFKLFMLNDYCSTTGNSSTKWQIWT